MEVATREPRIQSEWINLFDPEKYYPVSELLCQYLTSADFLILSQVCRGLSGLKRWVHQRVSNIDVRLRGFVDDPLQFRSQMAKHDAVIAGTFALNVLELSARNVPYMDVFVKHGPEADSFVQYLGESERYKRRQSDTEPQTHRFPTFTRDDNGMEVRVTKTEGPPIQHILTSSNTTACVNVITWNKVYSLFPMQTLIQHKLYPLRSLDDDFGKTLKDLRLQGWTTRDIAWPDFEGYDRRRPRSLRHVGDSFSLIIPLDTRFVEPSSTPDFVIEYSQFRVSDNDSWYHNAPTTHIRPAQSFLTMEAHNIQFHQHHNHHHHFAPQYAAPLNYFLKIQAQPLSSPAIRHAYTVAAPDWRDCLQKRLKRWSWVELFKLEADKRPIQQVNAFPVTSDVWLPPRFQVPSTWDYADDQIPVWYGEWQRKHDKRKRDDSESP